MSDTKLVMKVCVRTLDASGTVEHRWVCALPLFKLVGLGAQKGPNLLN